MKRRTIPSGPMPKLVIIAQGHLTISAAEEMQVAAETTVNSELLLQETGETVEIQCDGRLTLSVPPQATLLIESAHGNLIIQGVTGTLSIAQTGGNLSLENVGPTTLNTVGGSLTVQGVNGNLTAQLVGGHATVHNVTGDLHLAEVGGHLQAQDIHGGVHARVGGNAVIDLHPQAELDYTIEAMGNLSCQFGPEADATLFLTGPTVGRGRDGTRQVVLGDGAAQMHLTAMGVILINGAAPGASPKADFEAGTTSDFNANFGPQIDFDSLGDLGGMAEGLASQITAKVNSAMAQLSEQLPGILGTAGVDAEEIARVTAKVQMATTRAAAKAQARAEKDRAKAARRAEREMSRAMRHAEREAYRSQAPIPSRPPRPGQPSRPMPFGSTPPSAAPTASTQDEQMLILRMLEEKKITPSQANELLAALEN